MLQLLILIMSACTIRQTNSVAVVQNISRVLDVLGQDELDGVCGIKEDFTDNFE